jgi:hypothetical protein
MIHYHGTPVGGTRQDVARFLMGRHALVPFPRQDDIGAVAEVCQSFVFDNGAFSVWKSGGDLDIPGYIEWCRRWRRHPGFDWALIPDVIDGDEQQNDELIAAWPGDIKGVPVWHMHESIDRLVGLAKAFDVVALGSSGEFASVGTSRWWGRMTEALNKITDSNGQPVCKLHGLRMLDPAVFTKMPLSSADSTNASVNSGSLDRFGMYVPPTAAQRAAVIAERIEAHNSASTWTHQPIQESFLCSLL